jgi:hypothetical protein
MQYILAVRTRGGGRAHSAWKTGAIQIKVPHLCPLARLARPGSFPGIPAGTASPAMPGLLP